jgi:hypothetical protein
VRHQLRQDKELEAGDFLIFRLVCGADFRMTALYALLVNEVHHKSTLIGNLHLAFSLPVSAALARSRARHAPITLEIDEWKSL